MTCIYQTERVSIDAQNHEETIGLIDETERYEKYVQEEEYKMTDD